MESSSKKLASREAVLPHVFLETKISKEARSEIQKLYGPRPRAFFAQLVLAWAVIFTSIACAKLAGIWWATLIAIFIVASRQNILGLLIHDQAHKLGMKGQAGDILANLFAGYPLLVMSVETYAKAHLAHHKYYFTEIDPDHLRKSGREWAVPMTKKELFKWFLRDLSGLNILNVVKGKTLKLDSTEFQRSKPTPRFVRPVFLFVLFAALTFFKLWPTFLLYWVVPMMTVLPVMIRWGALSEHIYNTPDYQIEENSPLIIPSLLNRILMPNLNFSFHAYHHWYPAVSFSNLPKIHEIYRRCGLVDESKIFFGYASYLKFITSKDP